MSKYFFIVFCTFHVMLSAGVDHKSPHVSSYLEKISQHLDEKTHIKDYVSENNAYLDIGTGGDAIFSIAESLDNSTHCKLIAGDIDPKVLDAIKLRKPEIHKYLQGSSNINVEFQVLDATNMRALEKDSLNGVGASALAHEIYSYARPKEPLQLFIEECSRVLKKDGVFIYRDPKWTDTPDKQCNLVLDSKLARYFSVLFLPKFLDDHYTTIKLHDKSYKPNPYGNNSVRITFFEKGQNTETILYPSQLLRCITKDIDFSKKISVSAPLGLITELQRHYLVFLKSVFNAQNLEKLSTLDDHPELQLLENFLEKGVEIDLETTRKLLPQLCLKVKDRGLLRLQEDATLLIDPKLLVLLYAQSEKDFLDSFDHFLADMPLDTLKYFLLEGDEHYFYQTTDQFIRYVAEQSNFYLSQTDKKGWILAPISKEKIIFAERPEYQKILEKEMTILDSFGEIVAPETRKCIIHFRLMQQNAAIATIADIVKQSKEEYPSLNLWLNSLKKNN